MPAPDSASCSVTRVLRARSQVARSIRFASSIVCSTTFRRRVAFSRSVVGASVDGDLTRPASRAASGSVRSDGMLAEISERRRLDAPQSVAEVDAVDVQLEDVVLRVLPLDARREHDLLQLAAERAARRQEARAGQLLCQRAGALRGPPARDVGQRRGKDAARIDGAMLVEPLVFDADERLREVRRDALEGDVDPLLVEDRRHRAVRPVVHDRGLGGFSDVVERVASGQIANQIPPGPRAHQAEAENGGCCGDRELLEPGTGEHYNVNTR